jgi:methylthioribose-1-phosphate isomerase
MGRHGASLIEDGERILTDRNTGWLATTGSGTVSRAVYAATRTERTSKCSRANRVRCCRARGSPRGNSVAPEIPVTLLCDLVGLLMARGGVDRVLVGADRIARNGDTANKIGTYMVAVLAKRHGIPFHVVAPSTTFDRRMKDGSSIPIEERDASEVLYLKGVRVAAPGARAFAPLSTSHRPNSSPAS